ncbi:MAG: hypothetical protein M3Y87_33040 [Myxococcota bacterium]|nr:hypothetical protein [Myxococcota bacterium]
MNSFLHAEPATRTAALALVPVICLLSGCPGPVDQRAMDGLDALAVCDVRGAHAAFEEAWEMDETRSDVALAYALTDLALLAEDPAIAALAPRFGFDRPIDTALLWGENGFLHRMSRSDSCESTEEWFRATFPHPSAREGGPALTSTFDATLTFGDARAVLVTLRPRLLRVARALELAADHADEGVTIEGGCGLASTPTRVQAPELYLLAATLETLAAGTEALQSYDGELPLSILWQSSFEREEEWVATMNARFLRLVESDSIASSRVGLTRAASIFVRGIDAARTARSAARVSDAVLDWTALPARVLDDSDALARAIHEALSTDGMHVVPRMSPALSIDVGSFFTSPIDVAAAGPLWSVQPHEFGGSYIETDPEVIRAVLGSRFSPDPFADAAPSRSFDIDWSGIEWGPFGNPGDRWSSAYACE